MTATTGETIIDLGFPILHSRNGMFEEATTITVRAPGLAKREVWAAMKAYVARIRPTLIKHFAEMSDLAAKLGQSEVDIQGDEEAPAQEGAEQQKPDVLEWMAMGLGPEEFGRFITFVQKCLTNSPKLATVGDGESPINDAVWAEIEEKGGMDAINRIFSEFVDFFFRAPTPAPRPNGAASSATSSLPGLPSAPTKKRATSRSVN